MLTLDFDRVPDWRGLTVLDLGCGNGRHTFEVARRGGFVVSVDLEESLLEDVATMSAGVLDEGIPGAGQASMRADALTLPFRSGSFDVVIAAEVLEHIDRDETAMEEIARVLKPSGVAVVTVPRAWPERICWALSDEYHLKRGGHVRIYREDELKAKLDTSGLLPIATHHAHALHSPYWWIKCAFDDNGSDSLPARIYHRMLVWDIEHPGSPLRTLERALNPIAGKSLVVYARKEEKV
jgi:SAM-dependent methyltransferase